MIVGIFSDSHGHVEPVRKALALFDRLGVGHVIHCGDVGSPEIFDELVGIPCTFVWGNCDVPSNGMSAYLQTVGISEPTEVPMVIELDGKRFAVFHGHERGFDRAIETLDVDYLVHGHTHVARDERTNGKRVICPGALHRARPLSVATLDTASDSLTFHELGG